MATNDALEIIAEIHPQHGGDIAVMREMIRSAKSSGASVVKVQLYNARKLLGSDWEYLELSRDQFETLRKWCDQEQIELMASVFDEERLNWLRELDIRRYKIASRTIREAPGLCEEILSDGKETLVSLGMWNGKGFPFSAVPHVQYLYCKSLYPAMWEDMGDFPEHFSQSTVSGYSDHTIGLDFCFLAISRGAQIIEKHFTLNKTRRLKTEMAHICSMTPPDLEALQRIGSSLSRTVIFNDQLKRSGCAADG